MIYIFKTTSTRQEHLAIKLLYTIYTYNHITIHNGNGKKPSKGMESSNKFDFNPSVQ